MGVVTVGGTSINFNESDISDFFNIDASNPARSLPVTSHLAYILAIVAGALFALGALIALFNLFRDKFGVHLFIIVFALERVATYVIRAIMYHNAKRVYYEVFEILETAGFALIIVILWHVWAASGRTKSDGTTKRGGCCHCLALFVASFVAGGAAGLFAAGAVLQDRADPSHFDRGYILRKAAVIAYGAILALFDILCVCLLCRRGARATAPLLFAAGLLLSAKAAWEIYAMWHNTGRYYENKFWYPLGVLTELLVLLILVLPGFLRKALGRPKPALPVTGDGQYTVGGNQPHAPVYQPGPAIQPAYK